MQQYAGIYLLRVYSVLSKLAVNKYLHTAASCWILSIQSHDARNHEYKITGFFSLLLVCSFSIIVGLCGRQYSEITRRLNRMLPQCGRPNEPYGQVAS